MIDFTDEEIEQFRKVRAIYVQKLSEYKCKLLELDKQLGNFKL
jgi:hypothetical protein